MILSGTGWAPSFESTLDYAGKLAASVSNFFSGATKEASQTQADLRAAQQKAIAEIQTEQVRQETAKITGFLDWQRAKTFIGQWWWLFLILAFIIFWRPVLRFFGINTGYSRTGNPRRRVRKTKTVRTPRKTRTKRKGNPGRKSSGSFRRRIGNTVYTSKKKWSEAMLRRRKRAA